MDIQAEFDSVGNEYTEPRPMRVSWDCNLEEVTETLTLNVGDASKSFEIPEGKKLKNVLVHFDADIEDA